MLSTVAKHSARTQCINFQRVLNDGSQFILSFCNVIFQSSVYHYQT